MSQRRNDQQQKKGEGEAYSNFINAINSPITRREYKNKFSHFMQWCNVANHDYMLLISINDLEIKIRDYIVHLRHDKGLAPSTVSGYVAPIVHFYEMNGLILHWKRLKKFKAKHYSVVEDKPYTTDQIKLLVESANLRDKCIILTMCSAGLRRGALQYLRIRDLEKIEKYNLYKISVYKKEQEQYITFCTPECAKHIDQYLDWRRRIGEQLKPNSPIFRIEFDAVTEVNRPKAVSVYVIAFMVERLLDRTGIRTPTADGSNQRTELMQTHGFRKFFKTTCINAGVHPLYSEYLMGHRSGLTKSYFKPTDAELLEGNDKALGYVAAINDLTINEEHRLHKKIDELTKKNDEIRTMEIRHAEEIQGMRDQMNQIILMIQHNPKLARVKPEVLMKKNAT
ncbi:MAG TPA: site-specific integrase [Nitrososphaeraceae archaeon]|jgi:integrase